MKKTLLALLMAAQAAAFGQSSVGSPEIYELRVVRAADNEQIARAEEYLKTVWAPAARKAGALAIGVFEPIGVDTVASKAVYLVVPWSSIGAWMTGKQAMAVDSSFIRAGKPAGDTSLNPLAFTRAESSIMTAFPEQPHFHKPAAGPAAASRIYELRSYESPNERLHAKKVAMFNAGGEVKLFDRLGFGAVFYADVISGAHMPNLVYMVVHASPEEMKQHWKNFGDAPEWKALTATPWYENKVSVSHIEIVLLHRLPWSDL